MIPRLIFAAAAMFLLSYFTTPALAQSRVAIVAIDLGTGKLLGPKEGAIFGIDADLYQKFLDQAQKDKSYISPKSLSEKAFKAKYPNVKDFSKLYFTKSSPGCGWVYYYNQYHYVCW